jgi:FAD:protein FMN transferase
MRLSSRIAASLVLASLSAWPAHAQDPAYIHKKKFVMGTVFEIVAYDASSARASAAIDDAFQEIVRLDGIMSNYKPESNLSRLNRTTHFHAEAVPTDLYNVIEESIRYSRLSEGKFDITVGPLVNFWKAIMRGERAPSSAEEERLRRCVGYEKIVLVPPDGVELRSPCLQIDLGAIGKGYAVDRAVQVLRSRGISSALVNAGGSTMYGMGSPPGQSAWRVRLRDPSSRIHPEVMMLENSVSTSEQTAPSLLGEDSAGHIIDPESGLPVKTTVAVSAVAKTATASDALSTTLLLLGHKKGRELVKATPRTAAIWISPGGQVETATSGPQIVLATEDANVNDGSH